MIRVGCHLPETKVSRPVHYWFEAQAARTPDFAAVISAERILTYATLNQESNRLAHYLQMCDVKPETTVGICLTTSSMLAVAVFGILKAGGAYVPIEPSFSVERTRFMLRDSNVSMLITEEKYLSAFGAECPQSLCLDRDWPRVLNNRTENPCSEVSPQNSAYILYTSGSTGRPKGVVIEHKSLAYYLNWWCNLFRTEGDADLPLTSSFSFAAAISQFYGQLLVGRPLYMLSRDLVRQPDLLLSWFNNHAGHGLYCVPTLWDGVVSCAERRLEQNESAIPPACIYLTGESPPRKLLDRTFRLWPRLNVWNLYGPTEAVANVSVLKLAPGQTLSIGRAIPGTQLHVLDEGSNPVASGTVGEICIAGDGLARCYVNRPDLTAANFVSNPFCSGRDSRLYKTGDLCRSLPGGNGEYVGRTDTQVKIRGVRIELQEIEGVLLEHPAVRQAVVVALETETGERSLVAYVICQRSSEPSPSELRAFLQRYLPEQMMPADLTFLSALPVLPNGKLDRTALAAPSYTRMRLRQQYEAPRTPIEMRLAQIWAETLGYDRVGIHDNFFEIGGDSLRAANILEKVRRRLYRDVSYRSLFDFPTIASFAEIVEKCRYPESMSSIQRLPGAMGLSDETRRRNPCD